MYPTTFPSLVARQSAGAPPRRIAPTSAGFTIVELMVVIAILTIIAGLAAPSFTTLIERWRIRQASEVLKSTLYFARSEAIRRSGGIAIEKLSSGTNNCTSSGDSDWDCGWVVCADANNNGACEANESVLQRYDTPANVQITLTSSNTNIKLDRWGSIDGPFLGFSLVPTGKATTDFTAIGVCMSRSGRVRTIPPADIPCNNG